MAQPSRQVQTLCPPTFPAPPPSTNPIPSGIGRTASLTSGKVSNPSQVAFLFISIDSCTSFLNAAFLSLHTPFFSFSPAAFFWGAAVAPGLRLVCRIVACYGPTTNPGRPFVTCRQECRSTTHQLCFLPVCPAPALNILPPGPFVF